MLLKIFEGRSITVQTIFYSACGALVYFWNAISGSIASRTLNSQWVDDLQNSFTLIVSYRVNFNNLDW